MIGGGRSLTAGEALGEAFLEKPFRGAPILAGSLVKSSEDREGAFRVGPLEVRAEFGVAPCFRLDGAFGTAEEVSDEIERGAVGEEVAGNCSCDFVHNAWSGALDLGAGGWRLRTGTKKSPRGGPPRGFPPRALLDAEPNRVSAVLDALS